MVLASGSAKTVDASEKEMPCFFRFSEALMGDCLFGHLSLNSRSRRTPGITRRPQTAFSAAVRQHLESHAIGRSGARR